MNDLQRTSEWYHDRCGCLTASAVSALYDMKRDGSPKQAYFDLLDRLIAERVTGDVLPNFTSAAMQWGIDHEDEARVTYEAETGACTDLVGFVKHPDIEWLGASPDGLVDDDGLVEIKCPNTVTHLKRIRAGVVPEEYKPQMLLQLVVTGRKWCDFVDYDPRCRGPYAHLSFWTIRYTPTDEEREDMIKRCKDFLGEVQTRMDDLLA